MSKTLDTLIRIHDLTLMKKEFENEATASIYKEIGFDISHVHLIQQAIDGLEKKIDPNVLKLYKRVSAKYDRPLVPTKAGICYGCFVAIPTAEAFGMFKDKEFATCSNCGRLLYPLE